MHGSVIVVLVHFWVTSCVILKYKIFKVTLIENSRVSPFLKYSATSMIFEYLFKFIYKLFIHFPSKDPEPVRPRLRRGWEGIRVSVHEGGQRGFLLLEDGPVGQWHPPEAGTGSERELHSFFCLMLKFFSIYLVISIFFFLVLFYSSLSSSNRPSSVKRRLALKWAFCCCCCCCCFLLIPVSSSLLSPPHYHHHHHHHHQ